MSFNPEKAEQRITRNLFYNIITFLIIVFWFFRSTYDNLVGSYLLSFSIIFFIALSLFYNIKLNSKRSIKVFHIILLLIPISFIIELIYAYEAFTSAVFFPFYNLIGIKLNYDPFLILLYFTLTILKVLPIKFFYKKIVKLTDEKRSDDFFEYFTNNITNKKLVLIFLLLPLSAFIEEFIFRSLLLTVLVNYLNWNILIAIMFISLVFGFSHFSSSKNWLHFLSTTLSSIIYFFALIQLGLLYPWLLHLTTNSLALVFFYQKNRLKTKKST
ncbi:MAG: type II CAAX prenyl endopeptidase Rce1 family protein [Promethearchaeota archaeon]